MTVTGDIMEVTANKSLAEWSARFVLVTVLLLELLLPRWADAHQMTTAIETKGTEIQKNGIVRETALFPGWDPYEPVSAYVYMKPKAEKLPVVIFIHGMGEKKSWQAEWHRELAERGFAVIAIDAHLSGDRKIATSIGG